MDKKIAALLGAAAAFTTVGAAQAAPAPEANKALQAESYSDLLNPIPNAVPLLLADDAARAGKLVGERVRVAQYHDHHHHHHVVVIKRHHHHHHHVVVIKHHHHHHHDAVGFGVKIDND